MIKTQEIAGRIETLLSGADCMDGMTMSVVTTLEGDVIVDRTRRITLLSDPEEQVDIIVRHAAPIDPQEALAALRLHHELSVKSLRPHAPREEE